MNAKNIFITKSDLLRLQRLVESFTRSGHRDAQHLDSLKAELERAILVDAKSVPHDVVTMNSRVRVRDLDTQAELVYQIVFPRDANLQENRISVLAPIGTALLGYQTGSTIEWEVPSGRRRFYIVDVEYQPEAAGLAA
jgi:regulator of nucleoside diphosphate kinase